MCLELLEAAQIQDKIWNAVYHLNSLSFEKFEHVKMFNSKIMKLSKSVVKTEPCISQPCRESGCFIDIC